MNSELKYKVIQSEKSFSDFVESFWMLQNQSENDKDVIVLPDGRIDLIFSSSATEPIQVVLLGLETKSDVATIPANTLMFSVSFKLLATEYIFHASLSHLLNKASYLSPGFWNVDKEHMNDFDSFCKKIAEKLRELLPKQVDTRKQELFNLIYSSKGALTVKELSEKVFWSSRQINRYFNQQYGISLKTYCSILRFRASLDHIAEGKLFPEQNFTDQAHFIKEVKKFSGVIPKELSKNKNDRFILLSALQKK
ncbi:MAG: AraC family transcriptional regulator [Chitinophagaceae bacterium]